MASGYIEHYKDELLIALTSNNPEERSAAVTSFNEAGDSGVHDLIITLIDDPDQWVRHEVLEYLIDFGRKEDVKIIFDRIEEDLDLIFEKTQILRNITGRDEGVLLDDDPQEVIDREIKSWKHYLGSNKYL
jgi:hypothetical protein